MNFVLFAVAALSLWQVDAQSPISKGDLACRFFSDGSKTCQRDCRTLTGDAMMAITAKRTESGQKNPTLVSQVEIANQKSDPILFVACSDKPKSSRWTDKQEFVAFGSIGKQRNYVGTCVFRNDRRRSWQCRGCEPAAGGPQCHIGGQDGFKEFYKQGWTINSARDESTIAVTHG